MNIESFPEIDSWKEARIFVKDIYKITSRGSITKDFGFKDQLQRAAVSIMTNIAEGFDSGSNKSFINFLNYAYRSASEVQSLLYIALDIEYISIEQFNGLTEKSEKIKKLIGGFIQYLKNSNYKPRTKN
ncbi:MAG TPA: four helix bundle protein [Melioribacteraceae bacterium]|nr:four helix bundle protein [Melioribacteraceae bacterium]